MSVRVRWGVLAVSAVLLAACGSDKPSSDTAAATTVAGSASASTAAPASSASSTSGAATTAAGGSAAATTAAPMAATKDPFKIGYIGILSGANAALGQAYQAGFDNYFKALNARGGVNGHPIDFVVADDRGDPATGIAAYRNMVTSDKVLGVFGLIGSNVATGVQKIADSLETPIVGTGVVPPAENYSFVAGLDPVQVLADEVPLIQHLMQQNNVSAPKIAVISSDTVSGHAAVDPLKKLVEPMGMSVVDEKYVTYPVTQFNTEAAAIAAEKPDVVAVDTTAAGLTVIVKALRQAGVTAPIINYWVGASEQLLGQLADPEVYVYRDYADPAEDVSSAMRDSAKAQGLSDGTEFSSGNYYTEGYVMGQLIESVLGACGDDCTPAKFRDALETAASKIDTNGLTGTNVGFSPDNHVFIHDVRYFHYDPATSKGIPVAGMEKAPAY